MRTMPRRPVHLVLVASVLLAGCSGSDPPDVKVTGGGDGAGLSAEIASYDLTAGRATRFLVGVFSNDNARVLAYGSVRFRFTYLGTKARPVSERRGAMAATASYLPIPGQQLESGVVTPRLLPSLQAMGVYRARSVTFERAGYWRVAVDAVTDGGRRRAVTSFEVGASSSLPAPGDPAPRSRQALAGAAGVSPTAVDSRAGEGEPIPDPELHGVTIADALDAGRPLVVVVSTPAYCQSRFCGPITDSVARLARTYGDRMAFAHLEVWTDFDRGRINPAAAEWARPSSQAADDDIREPWVFTVGTDGIIRRRFDNVVSDAELTAAVRDLLEG